LQPAGAAAGGEGEGSSLSSDERAAIELANARAEQTATELAVVQLELARAKADKESHDWLNKGVEPWKVELAVPYLVAEGEQSIELSNGQQMSAQGVGEVLRKFLASDVGRIDLSGETPSVRPEESAASKTQQVHDQWQREFPLPGERQRLQALAALKARDGGNA
jgi:hypothetical protein